jgi:histidinol-phosphate aminotransferase
MHNFPFYVPIAPLNTTHTYFFLADFAPHNAAELADRLRSRDILIKPLNDPVLGPGYMRITTALPEENRRFVDTLREMLYDV